MATDLYQEITDRILSLLEQGVVPWRSPILGQGNRGRPRNLITQREYRGVNAFLLGITAYIEGYGSAEWLTFRQALQLGGHVRKGESSTLAVFWKQHTIKDDKTGEDKIVPVMRQFRVFNRDQCDGLPNSDNANPEPRVSLTPIEAAEQIVAGYHNAPPIEHGGGQAFYVPSEDRIQMPALERFRDGSEYFSTLFHEMAHSTAHSKRLDRGIDTNSQPFGSPAYAKEELIAEMGSAFLCGEAGISPSVIENQAAYIAGWMQRLRDDKRLVVTAAAAGQKAADWILGRVQEVKGTEGEQAE